MRAARSGVSASASVRFQKLLKSYRAAGVFNPWGQCGADDEPSRNDPTLRCRRLAAHLATRAEQVLIGEASGYQGCRVTGIPFTSERLVIAGMIPRIAADARGTPARLPGPRLSTRRLPWSEPSATIVWSTLHELGIADSTVLWNAFPWHPHRPQQPLSNRTPTRLECAHGLAVLQALAVAVPVCAGIRRRPPRRAGAPADRPRRQRAAAPFDGRRAALPPIASGGPLSDCAYPRVGLCRAGSHPRFLQYCPGIDRGAIRASGVAPVTPLVI